MNCFTVSMCHRAQAQPAEFRALQPTGCLHPSCPEYMRARLCYGGSSPQSSTRRRQHSSLVTRSKTEERFPNPWRFTSRIHPVKREFDTANVVSFSKAFCHFLCFFLRLLTPPAATTSHCCFTLTEQIAVSYVSYKNPKT